MVVAMLLGGTVPAARAEEPVGDTAQQGWADKEKLVEGESAVIAGGVASTWARVNGGGKVIWVGLTIPLSMVEDQPEPGTGPEGAVAVLDYPAVVQETTYFNHAEIHSNPHGHVANPAYADINRYMVPHFDFHFYAIPVAQVWTIPPGPPVPPVPAERVPAGYGQPAGSVPQMGRHSAPLSEFTATDTWELTMLAGFLPAVSYQAFGEPHMHFVEPMITREFLLRRENFTLEVPKPAVLGIATQYPTEFVAHYDKELDAYHFVFKGFERIE
jgi:hypothetical protein